MTTGIKNWSTTPGDNDSTAPNGFPEGMAPSQVNDSARQVMAEVRAWYEDASWIDLGLSGLTYVDGDTFRVTGDQTAQLHVGRRIRAIGTTPFTIYGKISASAYDSTNTTVDVTWDSGSLNNTLSEFAVGPEVTNKPIAGGSIDFDDEDIAPAALALDTDAETADFTVVAADKLKTFTIDCTSGDVTVSADAAALGAGFELTLIRTDASANTITLNETVNGDASKTLDSQYARLIVVSNGTQWFVKEEFQGFATNAEILAATIDNKGMTPADFFESCDFSSPGYAKIGPLIIQWGQCVEGANTFPTAFTSATSYGMGLTATPAASGDASTTVTQTSGAGFFYQKANVGGETGTYVAIGF